MWVLGTKHKLGLTLLASLAVLCGCTHQYLMKISDGGQIISATKPELRGAVYHFKDQTGVERVIAQNRVVKIKPVTVIKQQEEPPPAARPKKPKHWYFLWLA